MTNAYREDLRIHAFELIEKGHKVTEVVSLLKVCRATVYRWLDQKRTTSCLKPKANWRKGHSQKITDLDAFRHFVEDHKELTSIEMAEKWGNITPKTIRKMLGRIGYTRKKKLRDTWKEMSKSVMNSKKL